MRSLWCKIMFKTNVKQIEGNEGSIFIYTPWRPQFKEASKEVSMHALSKKTS